MFALVQCVWGQHSFIQKGMFQVECVFTRCVLRARSTDNGLLGQDVHAKLAVLIQNVVAQCVPCGSGQTVVCWACAIIVETPSLLGTLCHSVGWGTEH